MHAEASVRRWSKPLVIKREPDSIADIELGIETQTGVGIAAFNLEFPGMAVIDVRRSAIRDRYKTLT